MTETNGSSGGQVVTGRLWTGRPVTCDVCRQALVPTWSGGWYLPQHPWDDSEECGPCPAAGSATAALPVAARMADRIEEHFVAVMPPPHKTPVELQDVPEAKGLEPGEEVWT